MGRALSFPAAACGAVLACAWLLLPCTPASAANGPDAREYSLHAGTLDGVLKQFADASGTQLIYPPSLVRGRRSEGYTGSGTRSQLLARLLASHGLTAVAVNGNTFLLQRAPARTPTARAPRAAAGAPSPQTPATTAVELSAITVTGSRIPRTSYETATPVTVITSEDIERGAHGTLFELLRVQPGMFGHHPVGISGEGGNSRQPLVAASAASLYSLGPRGTLFLVDGRRVASFGMVSSELGGLFDLNGIPLSFIDRIEILRGGASAVYGADAIAGTINIILKKGAGNWVGGYYAQSSKGDAQARGGSARFSTRHANGAEVSVIVDRLLRDALPGDARRWHDQDRRALGLPDEREALGRIPSFYDEPLVQLPECSAPGLARDEAGTCRYDAAGFRTLQPALERHALLVDAALPLPGERTLRAAWRQVRSDQRLQAPPLAGGLPLPSWHPDYLDASGDASMPYYALTDLGPLRNRSVTLARDLALGLQGSDAGWDWHLELSRSESRVDSRVDNTLLMSQLGTAVERYRVTGASNAPDVVAALAGTIHSHGRHRLQALEAGAERRAFAMPGGEARIAAGLELREERLQTRPDQAEIAGDLSLGLRADGPTRLEAGSRALFLEFELPLVRRLRVDLAGRLDTSDDYPSRFSPRLGLRWTPTPSLLLRAAAGRGFRNPSPHDLRNPASATALQTQAIVPAVAPFTPCYGFAGICFVDYGSMRNPALNPETSRNLSAGVVWAPGERFSLSLDHYRIQRENEFDIADASIAPELFKGGLIRDADGVLERINVYLANVTQSDARGWELEARGSLDGPAGSDLDLRLAAHYLERHVRSSLAIPGLRELAGHDAPRLTGQASVLWRREDWRIGLSARHFGRTHAYAAGESCPATHVAAGRCRNPSATLLDLNIARRASDRWLLSLNINNLSDRQPVNYRSGFDGYNMALDDIYGRYYVLSAQYLF